jgi:proteasome accessory factor C
MNSPAGDRLLRLLTMLSYLADVGEAEISDLAERFGMPERDVVTELELAACCGLPPYSPDQLLELVVDDVRVHAFGLDALRRPPRLTPDEGFAVAATARALLAVQGADEGPLARALDKLERALGADRLQVDLEAPPLLERVHRAAAAGEVITIDYLGRARGEETTRVVEPYAVVVREGHFYLDAYCHLAGDWRRFQVLRINAVRESSVPYTPRTPPPELAGGRAFVGRSSVTAVKIAVPESELAFVVRFSTAPVEHAPDGRFVVTLEVGNKTWLGRLLLRLGEDAEVLEPSEFAEAASSEAQRALQRYR